ncbi:MAG TPA: TetR/AcrR family transcriptional regulator [Acidimicrobiales bacterium]|nr:TetR/AcrR family transcriptional regulator [Acidimicrobiales bacterium]
MTTARSAGAGAGKKAAPAPARGPRPLTDRGEQTRRRLLEAAEEVFARHGYHEASIVKITEAAGVAQGTFYLYFRTKSQVFEELVDDLNRRVRRAMTERAAGAADRVEAERLGLLGFLEFTARHPGLYRIMRQAELVSPAAVRRHYDRIARSYVAGLSAAMDGGEIAVADAEVVAWLLMAVGEMVGLRWVLWSGKKPSARAPVPGRVLDEVAAFIARGLGAAPPS